MITSVYPTLNARLQEYGVRSVRGLYRTTAGARNIYLLEFQRGADLDSIMEGLRSFGEIKSVSRNCALEFFANPNDFYYNHDWWVRNGNDPYRWIDQWYLKTIQVDKAWEITKGDSTMKVAIIDLGVDYFHPDLKGSIWVNPAEDKNHNGVVWDIADIDSVDDDHNGYVDDLIGWNYHYITPETTLGQNNNPYPDTLGDSPTGRHGTMMASFLACTNNDAQQSDSSIAGIVWYCKIVPLKVASVSDYIDAMNYAIGIGVDVINVSAGWHDEQVPATEEVVEKADSAGIMVVAADGPWSFFTYYPAACQHAIAVSGVDENGNLCPGLGYHDYVDICGINGVQPAKWLMVTTLDKQRDYYADTSTAYPRPLFPGSQGSHTYRPESPSTSCSTAEVSAVAALLKSAHPDATPDFIRKELLRGAEPTSMSAGRINPYRSLTQWGPITNDTIWANVAYVSADVKVDSGVTLTIDPGTTVYIAADNNDDLGIDSARAVLEVRGTLIAEGTAQSPIVFKSFADNPGPEDWYGIWFKQGSSGSLSHCRIENAKYGLKRDASIKTDDCQWVWADYRNVQHDMTVDSGLTLAVMPGTTVYMVPEDTARTEPDTLRVAMSIQGALSAEGTAAVPIVFRSMSEEPLPGDWYGILFADESSSGSLSHCVIQDARYGVKSAVTVDIADCQISNCLTAGIYMYDDMDTNSVVNNHSTISNCYVWNNIDGAGMRIWNCPYAISVDSCTVTLNDCGIWVSNAAPVITASNTNGNYSRGIWVTSYQYPAPYPFPVIQRCQMQGNGEEGIKCEYNKAQISYSKSWENGTYGILAYGDDADPVIDHSKIIDNPAAGLRVDSYAYPVLGNTSLGQGQYNSLYGQNQAKNVYNTTSQYIYAQNCWWGSNPPNASKFYGRVTYQPYLTSDPVYYLAPLKPNTPTVLSLEQNFPNPFIGTTGATTLKYAIPSESDRVVLRIFDVSGRRVCTLVDRPHRAGYYSARWDGRNERGGTVAPGVYFCEMSVGKQSFTKKIVLFR